MEQSKGRIINEWDILDENLHRQEAAMPFSQFVARHVSTPSLLLSYTAHQLVSCLHAFFFSCQKGTDCSRHRCVSHTARGVTCSGLTILLQAQQKCT